MLKEKRNLLLLGVIVCLGALLRFWQLGIVPHGVTHDELGYIYNAFSVAQTGTNIFGQQYPLFTYVVTNGFPFMPVPIYLSSVVFHLLPLSAFAGRFINALLGVISIILIYKLSLLLFKQRSIALASAFVLAVSPWHIFFSRTAYDVPVATFFYLLTFVSFLSSRHTRWLLVVSVVSFLLALFSYRGSTPMSIGLWVYMVWASVAIHKYKLHKAIQIGVLFCIPIILFALAGLSNKHRGFFAEATGDRSEIEKNLIYRMNESEGPLWLKRVFLNKPMYYVEHFVGNYIDGIAPGQLFMRGEGNQVYTMWMRGKVYLFEALLIGLGFIFLWSSKDGIPGKSVLGLLLLSGLPGMVGGPPFASRNLFMSIPLAILAGVGIVGMVSRKSFRLLGVTILLIVYSYSVSHFLFDYYARYAFEREESWVKSMKDASAYISQITHKNPHTQILMAQTTLGDMLQYAFYMKGSAQSVQDAIARIHRTVGTEYTYGNVTFIDNCPADTEGNIDLDITKIVLFVHDDCLRNYKPTTTIKEYYGNTIWKIYLPPEVLENKI